MVRAIVLLICVLTSAGPALAQTPTADQQAAIKANCRSDFMANCMGVPRGGKEALQCLEKNMASLSAGCQQAIKAITASAAPAAAPAATAKPAEPSPAPAPAAASTAPAVTPTAPATTTASPAPTTSTAPAAAPAAAAKTAAPAPSTASQPAAKKTAVTAPPPSTPPAAAPQVIVVAPRAVFALVRTVCRADYRAHCSDVDIGGGRVVACLQANAASLSAECRGGLASLGR